MSYKSPISVEFEDALSATNIDDGIVRVLCAVMIAGFMEGMDNE